MRHKPRLPALFALLAFLTGAPATAQDQATAAADFFDDSPQILTVYRISRPLLESPARVSVIARQMIDEASWERESADLFRLDGSLSLVGGESTDEDYEPGNLHQRAYNVRLSGGF